MKTAVKRLTSEDPPGSTHRDRARHLQALKRARARQARVQQKLAEADAEVRQLVAEGFSLGIPGQKLADAAGLSKPRVYQIRDGR